MGSVSVFRRSLKSSNRKDHARAVVHFDTRLIRSAFNSPRAGALSKHVPQRSLERRHCGDLGLGSLFGSLGTDATEWNSRCFPRVSSRVRNSKDKDFPAADGGC
jgi:hypothetical protein